MVRRSCRKYSRCEGSYKFTDPKGLNLGNNDAKWIQHAAVSLIHITQFYTKAVCENLANKYETDRSPKTSGVPIDPMTAGIFSAIRGSRAEKKVSEEFWQTYRPIITRASTYAWKLFPSIEIATGLYNIINIVKESTISDSVKTGFEESFQKILLAIKDKFPKWQPPKPKKDCFIATATMGNYDNPYVITLREYRDRILLRHSLGMIIVRIYYRISPPIAKIIQHSTFLRKLSFYLIIKPSVFLVNLAFSRKVGTTN